MSYRKFKATSDFTASMLTPNAQVSVNAGTSKGFTKWVNKDIRMVEETGDWSILLAKAQKSTKYFRNSFYR
jgi:hypothetical protein